MSHLILCPSAASALQQELLQSLPNHSNITPRGPATPLFERVQRAQGLEKLDDVHDRVFDGGVDTYLPAPRSDGRHRLPVVRVEPLLNSPELKPCKPSSVFGKGSD